MYTYIHTAINIDIDIAIDWHLLRLQRAPFLWTALG